MKSLFWQYITVTRFADKGCQWPFYAFWGKCIIYSLTILKRTLPFLKRHTAKGVLFWSLPKKNYWNSKISGMF